jgi:hypothetical protein
MTGINKRSIPPGQVAVHGDKSLTVTASNGRHFNLRPNGTLASFSAHGQNATFRADGHLASVHTANMDIAHGPHGQRTVISERPDHSRLVSTGRIAGICSTRSPSTATTITNGLYVHGGHSFMRTYSGYRYHGRYFDNYLPFYYYDPMFYGWAYYPWGAPIGYRWGWAGLAVVRLLCGILLSLGCLSQRSLLADGLFYRPDASRWLPDGSPGRRRTAGIRLRRG